MKTPQELAEEVVRNESWWGGTFNPPGDRRKLAALIAQAIEEAITQPAKQAENRGDKTFHKTK